MVLDGFGLRHPTLWQLKWIPWWGRFVLFENHVVLTTGADIHSFPYPSASPFHVPSLQNGRVGRPVFFPCRFQANRVGCACFCCSFKASKYLFDWAWHHDLCAKILHRKWHDYWRITFRNPCWSDLASLCGSPIRKIITASKQKPPSFSTPNQPATAPVYFESFPECWLVGWFHPFFRGVLVLCVCGGWLEQWEGLV